MSDTSKDWDNQPMLLQEAAQYLRLHPEVVRKKTKQGQIPAAKIGGQWRFLRTDIDEWLRSLYDSRGDSAQRNLEGKQKCLSTNAETLGTSDLPAHQDSEYSNLLRLPTNRKRSGSK